MRSNRAGVAEEVLGRPLAPEDPRSRAGGVPELYVFRGRRKSFVVRDGRVQGQAEGEAELHRKLEKQVQDATFEALEAGCILPGRIERRAGKVVLNTEAGFSGGLDSPSDGSAVLVVDDPCQGGIALDAGVEVFGVQAFPASGFRLDAVRLDRSLGADTPGEESEWSRPPWSLLRACAVVGRDRGAALELLSDLVFGCERWTRVRHARPASERPGAPPDVRVLPAGRLGRTFAHRWDDGWTLQKRPGLTATRRAGRWIVLSPQARRPVLMDGQAYGLLNLFDGLTRLGDVLSALTETPRADAEVVRRRLWNLVVDLQWCGVLENRPPEEERT